MQLVGSRGQQYRDFFLDASGSITVGGTSQLVLPEAKQRSFLFLQNISDTVMYFEFGSARATATLTSGRVSALTITNAGFGFTRPPLVTFEGGGTGGNSSFLGCGDIGYPAPSAIASAAAVLTTGVVTSFVINNPGSGYVTPPKVLIVNSLLDPFGCADPSVGSGSGLYLGPGQSYYVNGTCCTTDPISVYCTVTGKAFTAKYMS